MRALPQAFSASGNVGDVGLRFGQLLGELLLGQRRRLLLQLHVLDLRARRLELLLGGEPRLVARRAVPRASALQLVARRGQRLLRLAARASCRCSASSTGVQSMAARSRA